MQTPSGRAYIPVAGAHVDFDVEAILPNKAGAPQFIIRKLGPPKGSWLDTTFKFSHDNETMACLMSLPPTSFEIEVRLPTEVPTANIGFLLPVMRLIPIKTGCVLYAPCYATHSFTSIDDVPQHAVVLQRLMNAERAHYSDHQLITADDLRWVEKHYATFLTLFKEQRFINASNALAIHAHSPYPQIGLLTLWSGMEALFGIDSELRFRVSLLAAYLLEQDSEKRKALYDGLRKSYDLRSIVVHGSFKASKSDAINDAAVWMTDVLRRLLIHCIEQNVLPSEAAILFP